MINNLLYLVLLLRRILLKVLEKLNTYLKNMKKTIKEKTLPVFQSVSEHPNYKGTRLATSFYSFRLDTKILSKTSFQHGCHSFVKNLYFSNEGVTKLGVLTLYEGIPFSIEEISKYIELLQKIGFDIQFEGVQTLEQLTKSSNNFRDVVGHYQNDKRSRFVSSFFKNTSYENNDVENKKEFLVFTLGEDYKDMHAYIRYIALCHLRYLFTSSSMWFPRMFLAYYDYFKNIKAKPSLDKLLIFTYNSPIKHLYSKQIFNNDSVFNKSENNCRYGYYNFIGVPSTVNRDYNTSLSTLMGTDSNFKLIPYLESFKERFKNIYDGAYFGPNSPSVIIDLARTVYINDDNFSIQKTVNELVLKGEFHKAYVYLRDVVKKINKAKPDVYLTPPAKKIKIMDQLALHRTGNLYFSKKELDEILK